MDGLLGVAGIIINDYYGYFPHSLLSTSKLLALHLCFCRYRFCESGSQRAFVDAGMSQWLVSRSSITRVAKVWNLQVAWVTGESRSLSWGKWHQMIPNDTKWYQMISMISDDKLLALWLVDWSRQTSCYQDLMCVEPHLSQCVGLWDSMKFSRISSVFVGDTPVHHIPRSHGLKLYPERLTQSSHRFQSACNMQAKGCHVQTPIWTVLQQLEWFFGLVQLWLW